MTLLITAVVWLLGHAVHSPALVGAVVMAAAQGAFAQRVRFDAGIFHFWASRWHHPLAAAADLAAFDVRVGRQARGRFGRSGSGRTATRRHPAADLAGCLRYPATGLHRHCPLALTA
jgi:hypothetical protein